MAKEWEHKDVAYLKRYAGTKTLEELADRFSSSAQDVSAKLQELSLECKPSVSSAGIYDDPSVDSFGAGLEHLNHGKWKKAQAEFEKVIAKGDIPEVADRARQMLRVCEAFQSEPSGNSIDPFVQAVFEKNRGAYDAALKICSEGGRQTKEERFAYLAASVYALSGEADPATAALLTAVEMNPKNRIYAYHDPDFQSLLDSPEVQQLFEAS
ncbi:MAG: hypothetical protein K0U98_09515 [Deltaproteobacteria bacterium]|nr:hypothetical protein [Deltaproteobacteria bacterium]